MKNRTTVTQNKSENLSKADSATPMTDSFRCHKCGHQNLNEPWVCRDCGHERCSQCQDLMG